MVINPRKHKQTAGRSLCGSATQTLYWTTILFLLLRSRQKPPILFHIHPDEELKGGSGSGSSSRGSGLAAWREQSRRAASPLPRFVTQIRFGFLLSQKSTKGRVTELLGRVPAEHRPSLAALAIIRPGFKSGRRH